jgi:hypothetical protein
LREPRKKEKKSFRVAEIFFQKKKIVRKKFEKQMNVEKENCEKNTKKYLTEKIR